MARRKNYLWLGVKGLCIVIWTLIKYLYRGIVFIVRGIGYLFHTMGQKVANMEPSRELRRRIVSENRPAAYADFVVEKNVAGDFVRLNDSLLNKSLIILLFGRRGSGKSTLGFRLLENIHAKTKRPCFVLGVKQALVPSWISELSSVDEAQNGGVILVDEGAIAFSARESMSKKNIGLGKLLSVARHRDLTLLLITQNTGMIDKNVLSLTDVVMTKEGSLFQKKMERAVVKDLVEKADVAIKKTNDPVKHVYIFSDDFEGLCTVPPPSFWSQKVSKSQA